MGDVVVLDTFRARRAAAEAGLPSAAQACQGLAAGFRRMRAASVMLAEASAELRDLAREDSADAE